MDSFKTAARQAGLLYFVFAVVSVVNEFFLSAGFVVSGDAATTARNITAGEFAYRVGILGSFVELILFIVLVVNLYALFKDVETKLAILMVLFVSLGVAISFANLANKTAPLVLLSGADYLSSFQKPQLEALALGFLGLRGSGNTFAMAFWGLWLFPFGVLVIKSRFLPKVLGILLIAAGFAYVATSVTSILWPAYRKVVSQAMTPLYVGELPVIFWLLIKGATAPQSGTHASHFA